MDNYIALLLLVVPGFISRKIYEDLTDQPPIKSNFEETIYSLIFSVYNILVIYFLFLLVCWWEDATDMLSKDKIVGIFEVPELVVFYIAIALISSVLVAIGWKMAHPLYIKSINILRKKSNKNELSVSDSVFHDSFNDGEPHWVEICKDDKVLARGMIMRMDKEKGEYYLCDTEENFQVFMDDNGKIRGYKGYYFDAKNNLLIREIDETKVG